MIALSKVITPSPSLSGAILTVLEEGGEMAVVSVIAWYVHRLTTNFNMDENTGASVLIPQHSGRGHSTTGERYTRTRLP
jgi:hypothetical protein